MNGKYYKYLPISRLTYLENELLRFTQPADLNDPFECLPKKPSYEEFNNLIDSLIPKNTDKHKEQKIRTEFNSNYLDEFYKTQSDKVNEDIGIFSLSKNWKNSLMWAHYTESHKGFCLGFDSNHIFFTNYLSEVENIYKAIKDVIYSEKRVEIPMILGQEKLNYEPYITKSLDWSYEEEIRIVSDLKYRETSKKCNPFDIYLFKVPHSAIKEIILGANIELENEKILRSFASKKNITVLKSKISKITFNMERE